ncbi:MAG: lysophospholipid acyltransferase family protein [Proteobacteria bacterium]|nr:lysophospholipid acyltransferase family protein [Pseudomonadota bacterium]
MAFVLRILGKLPLPVLYALGWFIAFVTFEVLRWHRKLAAGNLERSFPDLAPAARARILRRAYYNLGQTLAEAIWGWQADADALKPRVDIDNRELIDGYVANRQSVVLLASHMCNWEWLVLAACAELGIPIAPLYKTLRLPDVDRYVRDARARFGGHPIELDNLLYELTFHASEPRAFAMLADQTPPRKGPKHWRRFLHQDTAFYAGLGVIARYLDAPVIFVAMRRRARGYYGAHLTVIAEPPYDDDPETQIIDRYAAELEREIAAAPANFLWVHRKWKYPKPADEAEDARSAR